MVKITFNAETGSDFVNPMTVANALVISHAFDDIGLYELCKHLECYLDSKQLLANEKGDVRDV